MESKRTKKEWMIKGERMNGRKIEKRGCWVVQTVYYLSYNR
jgi:hypothetical protein